MRLFKTQERLIAKTRSVAETRLANIDSEPRKKAQFQVTLYDKIATGFALDLFGYAISVIVWIEKQEDRDRSDCEQRHESNEKVTEFLEQTTHGGLRDRGRIDYQTKRVRARGL